MSCFEGLKTAVVQIKTVNYQTQHFYAFKQQEVEMQRIPQKVLKKNLLIEIVLSSHSPSFYLFFFWVNCPMLYLPILSGWLYVLWVHVFHMVRSIFCMGHLFKCPSWSSSLSSPWTFFLFPSSQLSNSSYSHSFKDYSLILFNGVCTAIFHYCQKNPYATFLKINPH